MHGPLPRYRELVAAGALQADPAQEAAAERLQTLCEALTAPRTLFSFLTPKRVPPRGVYLWGAVGRGKSLLMDVFFNNTDVGPKRRVHFHEFMAETHERIAAWRGADLDSRRHHPAVNRKSPDDPMPPVAFDIAKEARLLCFDEFQVTDIADAMILGRLFEALFAQDVVVVATSNRPPDSLYEDGINRQLFLPFIALLKNRLDIVELKAARDYRLERLSGAPVYHAPLDAAAEVAMEAAWASYICGARERREELEVKGRKLAIGRAARAAARLTFAELCERPLGAADYIALARRYDTLFLDAVPKMGPDKRNEAKRFVTLIDAVYEARTKLVCSAAAEPQALYVEGDGAFEFARAASRLMEMRSADYLGAEHRAGEDEKSARLPQSSGGLSDATLPLRSG
jgi:cell division protein ZapE